VQPLVVQGANFVNAVTGNRFQLVGVAYQPGGSSGYKPETGKDPLSNGDICLRDAALMQRLGMPLTIGKVNHANLIWKGVNAIRVYNLDPNVNHDMCASIFNAVGIYMLLDVNSPLPGESLDRNLPWTTYTTAYLNRTFAIVEAFKNYPNTLLFFAGNEVVNDLPSGRFVPPYLRVIHEFLQVDISDNPRLLRGI
jgi:hypothetical protein